jgi:DNA-binding transcriptional regulator YhcF (GntR family)
MCPVVDPASPVPLYHQIAEAIRAQIGRGELQAGDALEPMRKAADQWGVNLHTVRHAYAALAREGLLNMRSSRGTRVTEKARQLRGPTRSGSESVEAFVTRTVREASEVHGLSASQLAARIGAEGERGCVVTVVECSAWQCESHAREISSRWQVDTRAWLLSAEDEPEGDVIVATYFHYNDIRRRWPRLLQRVRFLTIRVDPTLESWLGEARSALIVERDQPTAEAVAADLRASFLQDVSLELVVTDDPSTLIGSRTDARVLCSPRIWSELPQDVRSQEHCAVVCYEFDESELQDAARECNWAPRPNKPGRHR